MPEEAKIRRATPHDAAAIASVLYESFVEFRALYTEGGFAATVLDCERVLKRISEGPVWIAQREELITGTVAAVVKGRSVYIRGMAVSPSARGSGIGETLLKTVEDWASGKQFFHLFLSTTPFLHSAIRLYEKLGFRRAGEEVKDLCGTPLFTLEKVTQARESKPKQSQ
jgi:N-acetylglutamate synthase-like GNAT family acetyltransferase